MCGMNYSELAGKSKEEIGALLKEKRRAHSGLVFLRAQGKVKNVHEIGTLKQDIARIATYQRSVRAQSQKT